MVQFIQSILSLFVCPLNHRWRITYQDTCTIEQRCMKCGKRVVRHF
jgi:transcription initiation factor IIE alpha subunit